MNIFKAHQQVSQALFALIEGATQETLSRRFSQEIVNSAFRAYFLGEVIDASGFLNEGLLDQAIGMVELGKGPDDFSAIIFFANHLAVKIGLDGEDVQASLYQATMPDFWYQICPN